MAAAENGNLIVLRIKHFPFHVEAVGGEVGDLECHRIFETGHQVAAFGEKLRVGRRGHNLGHLTGLGGTGAHGLGLGIRRFYRSRGPDGYLAAVKEVGAGVAHPARIGPQGVVAGAERIGQGKIAGG